jgi:hypothetical protein
MTISLELERFIGPLGSADPVYEYLPRCLPRWRSLRVYVQKAVLQPRRCHLDSVSEDESPAEASGGDAPVDEVALGPALFALATAGDDELVVTDADRKLLDREARHGQGDSDSSRAAILDVVRRIALCGGTARPLEKRTGMLETEQQRVVEDGRTIHGEPLNKRPRIGAPQHGDASTRTFQVAIRRGGFKLRVAHA